MTSSWFKENFSGGDWISVVTSFIVALVVMIGGYYSIRYEINREVDMAQRNAESALHEIQRNTEQLNNLLLKLDNRYVEKSQFNNYKIETNRRFGETNERLDEIASDIKYLIQLQIEGNRNRNN